MPMCTGATPSHASVKAAAATPARGPAGSSETALPGRTLRAGHLDAPGRGSGEVVGRAPAGRPPGPARGRCACSRWPGRPAASRSRRPRSLGRRWPARRSRVATRCVRPPSRRRSRRLRRARRPRRAGPPRRSPPPGSGPMTSPGTATLPAASCSVARMRHSEVSASGNSPPKTPECCSPTCVRTSTVTSTRPRSEVVNAGNVDPEVRRVGDHHDVGREQVAVLGQERMEGGRADLLLPLDEDGHPDRQLVTEDGAQSPQGTDVGDDAGLVVGGSAAVQPAVAFDRLERLGLPVRSVPGRLDVVVRVEQNGGSPRRRRVTADHRGRAALGRQHADLEQPGAGQVRGDRLGAARPPPVSWGLRG